MNHTRKLLSLILSLSLVLTLAQPALASEALGDDVDARSMTLHRGVELAEGVFWSDAYSDLRHENYIVYSPSKRVTPIITYGASVTDRTTVAEAAAALESEGYRVVAGINGDYYGVNNGVPMGSVVAEGELRVAAASNYAIGFRADGTAILGAPELSVTVESEHGSFAVASMNQVRYSYGGIYLYSDEFNARATTGTNAAGYDLVCSVVDGRMSIGETLTLTVDEILPEATDTVVPEGKYVLTANLLAGETALEALRAFAVGDMLTVTVTAADEGWNDVEYAIGALYQLVENGRVCDNLETGAAPRTAVGQRKDGSVIFYTIDGRSSGYSIGATLTQVAERLMELGCVTALSLDGGGSTTLSVTLPEETSASVYNAPSGGTERAVTNHIFLVASNEPSGRLDHISLRTESTAALARADVTLTAAAVDTSYLPMSSSLSLRTSGGTLTQTGETAYTLTAPERGGTVKVTASRGSHRASETISVITSPERIELWCDGTSGGSTLRLAPGQSVALEARAYEGHLRLTAQNDCFTWTLTGDVGTIDEDGTFTAADHVAYGTLTVSAGKTELELPVYVSADPYVLLDGFEDEHTLRLFAYNTDKTYVRCGAASARWDYSADGAAETVECLAAQPYRIPDGYERVSLWVYGDGSGAQLSLLTYISAEDTEATETNAVTLDFTGWQRVSFDVSGAWQVTGFVLRPTEQTSGTLYLDQLTASRALAAADTDAPDLALEFSDDGASLTGKVFDGVDGASLSTLRVTYDGKPLSYTYDHQTGALHAALPAADGAVHRVTVTAGDASGNLARASLVRMPETVGAAFPDTDGHRANVAVSYLKSIGVTTGDEKGSFNPESAISRQEFAVLLARWLGASAEDTALPFADSAEIGAWALDGVRAMYALGVTKGSKNLRGELCFDPRSTISRQEAMTMLGRLVELGYAVREQSFTDADAIADWAKPHLDTLASLGAPAAYEDGSVLPTQPITRAEVAELLFTLS